MVEKRFSLTRGDTFSFAFRMLNAEGDVIIPDKDEVELYFTIKLDSSTDDFILQKKLSTGEIPIEDEYIVILLEAKDTEELPYGSYTYDVEFDQDGYVQTLIYGTISLTKEATFKINK